MKATEVSNKEFQFKRLSKQDVLLFQKLVSLFHLVFEMKNPVTVKASYLKKLLSNREMIIYVVIHKKEVIGGLTAYLLPMYYAEHREVFIYDVAIKTEFQRKGLGKKLLSVLEEDCKQEGIKELFVAAHEKDKYALTFYKETGGKAEKVVHFSYLLNKK